MSTQRRLLHSFIAPILRNVFVVFSGLVLAATPFLMPFYQENPGFKTAAMLLGPLIVIIGLLNMTHAALSTIRTLGLESDEAL